VRLREAAARPVTFGEVDATLFCHLGIDVVPTMITPTPMAARNAWRKILPARWRNWCPREVPRTGLGRVE
jgi:hypothetical protein